MRARITSVLSDDLGGHACEVKGPLLMHLQYISLTQVLSFSEACFDLISGSSLSMKIQIIAGNLELMSTSGH